ncbi:HNH endonuclease signature motif containing protein [Paractinoplanes rishiriensis]|nr:HNH endonuclease signature motif containing protein [Actinoplanes rishiriensis]
MLPDTELVDSLRAVHRLEQTAALLKVRLVHEAERHGVPGAQGHRTTARWLRDLLLMDPAPARELAERAETLLGRPGLEEAILDGHLDIRQGVAIAEALDAIPDDLADDESAPDAKQIAAQAETVMTEMAERLTASQLRQVGDRILAHVAPEVAERVEEAALRRREARAYAKRFFSLSRPAAGMVRVSGILTTEDAAIVNAALDPLCMPRPHDDRLPGQRRADALVDVCRLALRNRDLPANGGEPPQVSVTVAFDPLTGELGGGTLADGERVSAATVRRYACDARILPFVMGGQGQILDAGRSRRLVTGSLRRALVLRDQGCAFPDCDRPARWCDGHHLRSWYDGGTTCLDNLALLCGHHHRKLHDPASGWQARLGTDRLPEFIPPAWIDPEQRPRRNLFHPRK